MVFPATNLMSRRKSRKNTLKYFGLEYNSVDTHAYIETISFSIVFTKWFPAILTTTPLVIYWSCLVARDNLWVVVMVTIFRNYIIGVVVVYLKGCVAISTDPMKSNQRKGLQCSLPHSPQSINIWCLIQLETGHSYTSATKSVWAKLF